MSNGYQAPGLTPGTCLVQDLLLPYVLKIFRSLSHCSFFQLTCTGDPDLSDWWMQFTPALIPSPHPGPKPAIIPSQHRLKLLFQLLTSRLRHCLPETLPCLSTSLHVYAFLMHCCTKKALRKTFKKVCWDHRQSNGFSVSFYPTKMPLAFDPDWAPWGGSICFLRTC